ncbi:MAG: hypothetical protein LIP11_00660, partial [Clostridiales bacterium]|nr:hypothetical protein [Clostridiales bacterium]
PAQAVFICYIFVTISCGARNSFGEILRMQEKAMLSGGFRVKKAVDFSEKCGYNTAHPLKNITILGCFLFAERGNSWKVEGLVHVSGVTTVY